jgi:hypothetical protein
MVAPPWHLTRLDALEKGTYRAPHRRNSRAAWYICHTGACQSGWNRQRIRESTRECFRDTLRELNVSKGKLSQRGFKWGRSKQNSELGSAT